MPIYREKVEKPFCPVPMEIARDTSLSLKELGLMTKLYAFREDWKFTLAGLAKTMKCGVSQIQGTFKCLVEKGYIEMIRVRGPDGRFERTDLRLFRNPSERTESPSSDFPHMDKPHTEKLQPGIPYTGKQQEEKPPAEKRRESNNKDSNNKDSNNNESIMKEFSMKRSTGSYLQGFRRKNSFNNFEQRDYDYAKLERELLQAQDRVFLAEKEQEEMVVSDNEDAGQADAEISAATVAAQTGEVIKGA